MQVQQNPRHIIGYWALNFLIKLDQVCEKISGGSKFRDKVHPTPKESIHFVFRQVLKMQVQQNPRHIMGHGPSNCLKTSFVKRFQVVPNLEERIDCISCRKVHKNPSTCVLLTEEAHSIQTSVGSSESFLQVTNDWISSAISAKITIE